MMNILVGVSSSPDKSGGISSYSKELALCLRRKGHVIHYVCPACPDLSWFDDNGIHFLPVKEEISQEQQCKSLYEYVVNKNIDLIINNDNSIVQSIAPLIKCPLLAVCHMESRAIAAMAAVNSEWCDYIIAISYDMQHRLLTKYKLDPIKVPVVFGGLNTEVRIKGTNKMPSGQRSSSPLRCIFSGGYSRHKGGDLFLKFLTSRSVPDNTEYFWFGDVPPQIKRKLSTLKHVKHVGRVSREKFLVELANADVLLFPSRQEGCPMSILEAMNFEVVPLVSNGRGAMRHIITHGKDGFVCSLENWINESANVLTRLSMDKSLLSSYGQAAARTCRGRFSIEEMVETLLALSARPTVNRVHAQTQAKVYRWHRPGISSGTRKASLLERLCYRAGIVRAAGVLRV